MNCRLFSQHENYTTESQIVKLIYNAPDNASELLHNVS